MSWSGSLRAGAERITVGGRLTAEPGAGRGGPAYTGGSAAAPARDQAPSAPVGTGPGAGTPRPAARKAAETRRPHRPPRGASTAARPRRGRWRSRIDVTLTTRGPTAIAAAPHRRAPHRRTSPPGGGGPAIGCGTARFVPVQARVRGGNPRWPRGSRGRARGGPSPGRVWSGSGAVRRAGLDFALVVLRACDQGSIRGFSRSTRDSMIFTPSDSRSFR